MSGRVVRTLTYLLFSKEACVTRNATNMIKRTNLIGPICYKHEEVAIKSSAVGDKNALPEILFMSGMFSMWSGLWPKIWANGEYYSVANKIKKEAG